MSAFAAEPPGPTPDQQTKDVMEKNTETGGAMKVETEHGVHPGTMDEGEKVHDKKMEKRIEKKMKKKAAKKAKKAKKKKADAEGDKTP